MIYSPPAILLTLVLALHISAFAQGSPSDFARESTIATTLQGRRSASNDDPDSLTAQALAATRGGDLNEAHRLLHHAIAVSPNHPSANDALGNLMLFEHHYTEAMDRFETVLATNLHDPAARKGERDAATAVALEARRSGDANGAYLSLQHAHEHLPDDPTLLLDLGIQAQQMHLLLPAAEALNAALALKPGDPSTLYALARVETDQDRLAAAEQRFRAYLAARPNDASAHFGLGHVLERQQRIDEARAEFQRSIDLQPVQTESYYQLGQMALDAGQPETAGPLFGKALDRDPHHGGALTGLGILAYRRKDYAAARDLLATAIQSSPDYQPAHYYLGLALGRLGEKAGSERELKTATDLAHRQDAHAATAAQSPKEP